MTRNSGASCSPLYAQANLATKRAALERLDPPASCRPPRWKREAGLIEWLKSL